MAKPRSVAATLLAVETAAFAVVLYLWLPLYRRLLSGPGGDRPGGDVIYRILAAVVVMQACYWTRRRVTASVEARPPGDLLGHALLFASRLAFVFVGSTFGLFIVRAGDIDPGPLGLAISRLSTLRDLLLRLRARADGAPAARSREGALT